MPAERDGAVASGNSPRVAREEHPWDKRTASLTQHIRGETIPKSKMIEMPISNTSPLLYFHRMEAKSRGLSQRVSDHVDRLESTGMWMSDEIRRRVLALAGEDDA